MMSATPSPSPHRTQHGHVMRSNRAANPMTPPPHRRGCPPAGRSELHPPKVRAAPRPQQRRLSPGRPRSAGASRLPPRDVSPQPRCLDVLTSTPKTPRPDVPNGRWSAEATRSTRPSTGASVHPDRILKARRSSRRQTRHRSTGDSPAAGPRSCLRSAAQFVSPLFA